MISLSFVAGGDPRAIQQRGGHSDLNTTFGYYHHLGLGLPQPVMGALGGAQLFISSLIADCEPPALPDAERSASPPELAAGADLPALEDAAEPSDAIVISRSAPRAPSMGGGKRPVLEDLAAVAEAWLRDGPERSGGKGLPRPHAVTAAARKAGSNAYAKAHYRTPDKQAAAAAWKKAYRAVLQRWQRALTAAQKRR
jgi:hypothetical protein